MIVKMKKAAIIVQSGDSERALGSLRLLGALHVEHQNPPSGKDINAIKEDMAALDKAINIISSPDIKDSKESKNSKAIGDWRFAAKHIIDTAARIDHLTEYSKNLKVQIDAWQEWGDFDPSAISALKDKGINIKLCKVPVKDMPEIEKRCIVKSI